MGWATVAAPAKVNLVLRVVGRRPDGYHEIDTLFQAIDLCDDVEVELGEEGVTLDVEGPDLGPDEENLAYRAAVRVLETVGTEKGARVRLTKRLPIGAGLGGGSSNAAAVLRCLAELVGGIDMTRLLAVAAELGSDVPFFLGASPLARGRGRGEVLEPLPALPPANLVLVSPPVRVSTAGAYAALSEVRGGEVAPTQPLVPSRIAAWRDLESVAHNDFEPVISAAHAKIVRALDGLRATGASVALMTGSGSSCFGLYPGRSAAVSAAKALEEELGFRCEAVRTLAEMPRVQRG